MDGIASSIEQQAAGIAPHISYLTQAMCVYERSQEPGARAERLGKCVPGKGLECMRVADNLVCLSEDDERLERKYQVYDECMYATARLIRSIS
jgi:hypothetical protein